MDFPIDLEEIKKQDELHNKSQSIFDEELETCLLYTSQSPRD